MPNSADKGFVYIATGVKYINEAIQSAKSLRRCMPEAKIALFTKEAEKNNVLSGPFTELLELENVHYSCLDKLYPLVDTPYEKTIFLDTDTYVCDGIGELFDILDRFDIAAAHAPYRVQYPLANVPEAFPELNTGLIAFRKTENALGVLKKWPVFYLEQKSSAIVPHHDQHSFRRALYESDAHFLVLPSEYNFRTIFPGFAGKGCHVKILHGRQPNLEIIGKRINRSKDFRITLLHPFRIFSKDLIFIANLAEYLSELIYLNLPLPLQRLLTKFKHTVLNQIRK